MTTGSAGEGRAAVSVVIATLNRPDALRRCLDALLASSRLPTEIIVVDQSDDEATRLVVDSCNDGYTPMRYVHQTTKGMSRAQNVAFALAASPIVAITDDDCQPDREWIATIERGLDEQKQTGIDAMTGRVLPLPPEGERAYPVATRLSRTPRCFAGKTMPWEVGSGNNVAVRTEWLARIGGCDERLGPGAPGKGAADMDLFYRLLRSGARIRYEPELIVHHQRHTRAERLGRRRPYGYGMAACCALYLRQGDWFAPRMLASWLLSRSRRIAAGLRGRDWQMIYEELLTLGAMPRGLIYGARLRAWNERAA